MDAFVDTLVQVLTDWGYVGLFISALLAGSIIPFSSELVMAGLQLAGADPWGLVVWGTLGNTLGGLLNYGIGRLGREEWITRYAKVSPERLERGRRWVHRYGAWAGLLSWLPVVGELITVAMGYLRVNWATSLLAILVGKGLRYYVVVFLVSYY